ncbi:hypothetical protein BH09ACT7_BH09ACT7_39380 [soil metagenome]
MAGTKLRTAPLLRVHTELGDTMLYLSLALVVAAMLPAVVHLRESRGLSVNRVALWSIATVVIVACIATTLQVHRIGDSGARAVWSPDASGLAP